MSTLESRTSGELERPHHKPGVIWKPSNSVHKNPTEVDEAYWPLLPEFRAGNQSTCAVVANPREKNQGRQRATYVDTGLNNVKEEANCMGNRVVWQAMSTRGRQW